MNMRKKYWTKGSCILLALALLLPLTPTAGSAETNTVSFAECGVEGSATNAVLTDIGFEAPKYSLHYYNEEIGETVSLSRNKDYIFAGYYEISNEMSGSDATATYTEIETPDRLGVFYIKVTGKDYFSGDLYIPFEVLDGRNLSNGHYSLLTEKSYLTEQGFQIPYYTVTSYFNSETSELIKGTDYEFAGLYENIGTTYAPEYQAIDAPTKPADYGTYYIKVVGKGDYTGELYGSFYIEKKNDDSTDSLQKAAYEKAVKKAKARKVKTIKVSALTKKRAKVTWSAVSGVSGYQIKYSYTRSFKTSQSVLIRKGTTKKAILRSLKAGRKCYIKIRPYTYVKNTGGGKEKIRGKWSVVKVIKVKK